MTDDRPDLQGSPRRRELLERTVDYISEQGASDVSLRRLATAIGSSPGVLLYLFGSKEELLAEVFTVCRQRQLALLNGACDATDDTIDAMRRLWNSWLADPGRAGVMRLFFENYVRSLQGATAFGDFAAISVRQWLDILGPMSGNDTVQATLTLGVLRGLLLDVLATGDSDRVNHALERYLATMASTGADQPMAGRVRRER